MDSVHIHLILTHIPIIGTILGTGILFYGVFVNDTSVKKVALAILVLMAIFTIPVFLTGEGAEETVEHLSGVSEDIIHNHEELAEIAIWLMSLLGILALFNIFAINKKYARTKLITIITLVFSLVTFGVFVQVGNLGGQIRHSEIRSADKQGVDIKDTTKGFLENNKKEHNEDDDDD